jgi:hypothetical protein
VSRFETVTWNVDDAATVSNEAHDFRTRRLVALITDAGLNSVALRFQVAPAPGGTFVAHHDSGGTRVSLTVAASRNTEVPLVTSQALHGMVKIDLGTAETGATVITGIVDRGNGPS